MRVSILLQEKERRSSESMDTGRSIRTATNKEDFHEKLSKGSSRKSLTSSAIKSLRTFSTAKRLTRTKWIHQVTRSLPQLDLFNIQTLNAMVVAKHQSLVQDTSAAFARISTSAQPVKREETILIHS
jgi:hypothetical protein